MGKNFLRWICFHEFTKVYKKLSLLTQNFADFFYICVQGILSDHQEMNNCS